MVEKKGHSCGWLMFSQASIPHKQLCLYKTGGQKEKEKKDSVLGMTSFRLVCSTSPTVDRRVAGKVTEAGGHAWYKCMQYSYMHVFIRYTISLLSTLPSPPYPEHPNTFG